MNGNGNDSSDDRTLLSDGTRNKKIEDGNG